MKRVFVWATVSLLLGACASKPLKKPSGLKASDFFADQASRRSRLAQVSAKLYLRYTGRAESGGGRGRFLQQPPNRMRLELRDPLGRTQYLVTLDGDEFAAFYPTQKRVYVDKQGGLAYMKRFLGFGFSYRDLESLLLGMLPSSAKVDKLDDWHWEEGIGAYRGTASRGDTKVVVDVEPDTATIRELVWESGREKARIVYGDVGKCCQGKDGRSVQVAHSAKVTLEQLASKLEVEWDEIDYLDVPKGADTFRPPSGDGVQRITLP